MNQEWRRVMLTTEQRIAKARSLLILEHPFIGSIAMSLPIELDEDCPTAWVDGKSIAFNPTWVDKLTDDELLFVVAHECMHPMLEHPFRKGTREHKKWNQAGDFVINHLLTEDKIGMMPKGGLLDEGIYNSGGGTTDGIYNILQSTPDGSGGDVGEPLDDCRNGGKTKGEMAEQEAKWKVKVAQASQSAKMVGKLSKAQARLANEILHPNLDWREVLQRFLVRCKDDSRTWAKPNRRFIAQGLYLPSVSGEAMGELVIAVDCSGSIGEEELAQFSAEIRKIKEDTNPTCIHVVYFDSEVSHYDACTRDDELDIKMHGGGGTAFSPIFKYVDEHGIEPTACVVLTDLCCNDFGDAPQYPVLWVSTEEVRDKVPFGETIEM